jgi:ATP-binding cassette, subfamily A (ABC1), member 3
MIYRLVYEKEKKIREGMKMMGMTNLSFYLSWFIWYGVIYTLISLLMSVLLTFAVFAYT